MLLCGSQHTYGDVHAVHGAVVLSGSRYVLDTTTQFSQVRIIAAEKKRLCPVRSPSKTEIPEIHPQSECFCFFCKLLIDPPSVLLAGAGLHKQAWLAVIRHTGTLSIRHVPSSNGTGLHCRVHIPIDTHARKKHTIPYNTTNEHARDCCTECSFKTYLYKDSRKQNLLTYRAKEEGFSCPPFPPTTQKSPVKKWTNQKSARTNNAFHGKKKQRTDNEVTLDDITFHPGSFHQSEIPYITT